MKQLFILCIACLLSLAVIAQVPQAFNYQAKIRNAEGVLQTNVIANFKIEILQEGEVVYSEEHSNLYIGTLGVVNFLIGKGTNPSTDFSKIEWRKNEPEIRVAINNQVMGTSPLVAVPYSLHAGSANNIKSKELMVGPWPPKPDDYVFFGTNSLDQTNQRNYALVQENNNGFTFLNSPYAIAFRINNEPAMFLSNEKNLGIGLGADSPTHKLDVGGAINLLKGSTGKAIFVNGVEALWYNGDYFSWGYGGNKNYFADAVDIGGALDVNGRTKTKTLEIVGGSDGAEYFNVLADEELDAGSLVIIDNTQDDKLKISEEPYDTRLAGIISGAGGVQPGIVLQQKGVLEGNQLISIWGRVKVKATTENGSIKPGDLLTSSSLKGHVMKATKRKKSRGAIIGRALSSLESGEGLVLVLIQPQ